MRIAVSGTHGSGKSTLINAFLGTEPGYLHEPEPFERLDEAPDEPGADSFFEQLGISRRRLRSFGRGTNVIAERCPLDFLAYLLALEELSRPLASPELTERATELFPAAMSPIDLLVVLPLESTHPISIPDWEDLELRDRMNDILLELAGDTDLVGDLEVVELAGPVSTRLAMLTRAAAH